MSKETLINQNEDDRMLEKNSSKEFVDAVLEKDFVQAKTSFKEMFYEKFMEKLEEKKKDVAEQMFGEKKKCTKEEEEMDDSEDEEDEADDDEEVEVDD
jgi:hypothetical protein